MNISEFDPRGRSIIARILVTVQFSLLGVLLLLSILGFHHKVHSYFTFELILASLGGILILIAAKNLKPSLKISPIPKEGAPLISVGVYKYVRHPMYLAVILIGFSFAGYGDTVVGWTLEVLLILTLNIKATFEDALILELHPEALHFQMHTSKLVPCVGNTCRQNCNFYSESN